MAEIKKKKIAFVMEKATTGGIEASIVELMKVIDSQKYDITLFTNKRGNPFVASVPIGITVCFTDDNSLKKHFYKSLNTLHLYRAGYILLCYIALRLSKSESSKAKYSCMPFTLSEEPFDCVVAYKPSCKTAIEAQFHIDAPKKAVWIHGAIADDKEPEAQQISLISMFDKAFCVSEWTKEYFVQMCPKMSSKTEVFYNLIDSESIRQKSNEPAKFIAIGSHKTIVTVGRLVPEKGQDLIPKTARLLLDAGYCIKWYVIGDGLLKQTLKYEIAKYQVENNVIHLGTQLNPFPYMKLCDVYVQTSRSEGWCLTTQEASVLLKPIVTTDLPVMHEQFEHLENGIIADEISSEGLFRAIKLLLDDPELCKRLSKNLEKKNHNREGQLQKLYDFFDS